MAYSEYTLKDLEKTFGIKNVVAPIFDPLQPIQSSEWLMETLAMTSSIRVRTEKAKSEAIVFPILMEIKKRNEGLITIYSGDTLEADSSVGLVGECDFIITRDVQSFEINYPILQVVEAKRHDMDAGIPQCAAQMVGAKIYNEKNNTATDQLYGCVTTGNEWRFLKLDNDLIIDRRVYYLIEIGELLAAFQSIVDAYKDAIR